MSHAKERKEKACLNCSAAIYGRYCHICGQENVETKESFWYLVKHFIEDITHFDGKFFSTLKYLLFRPGFLTTEYLRGKRASYLHPIRMYVFTSAIFFIAFFFVFHPAEAIQENNSEKENLSASEIKKLLISEKKLNEKTITTLGLKNAKKEKILHKIQMINSDLDSLAKDTLRLHERLHYFYEGKNNIIDLGNYKSVKEFDSIQKSLPKSQQKNGLTYILERKAALLNEKYKNEASAKLIEVFFHKLPQILFFSLPLFAGILYLLYMRKKIYYVEHGIFTIHLYVATFILMLCLILSDNLLPENIHSWVSISLFVVVLLYLYKAMHNFYKQSRIKTIIKLLILNSTMLFVIAFLFVSFFLLSFFSI